MKLIESKTLASSQASIEFTSIPATFTDLVILISSRVDGANGTLEIYFNTDTTNANYSYRRLAGDGSIAYTNSGSNSYFAYANGSGQTANTFANGNIYIPNYTSTVAKSLSSDVVQENNATSADQFITAGLWTGTVAINRVFIRPAVSANFVSGTIVSLYGVLKGSDGIVTTS
jgi:hypothetical protein